MKKIWKRRKVRYGSVAVLITALVIAAVVIVNAITAMLAARYDWMYADMSSKAIYSVSDRCRDYVEKYVVSQVDRVNVSSDSQKKIKIIFCDTKENVEGDNTLKYIHDSVNEITDMFDGYFSVDYLNIWENPTVAAGYGIKSTTDIVCEFDGKHETVSVDDFYIFDSDDTTMAVAYNGEKILASCLMRITQKDTHMCYFTANHGESFDDPELMRCMVEAGYTVGFVDVSASDIPQDCELLITFAPKQDMTVEDANTDISEIARLNAYMDRGGKYLVFLSADTFASGSHKNFEGFLEDWGVKYDHSTGVDGTEKCYLIRDTANSLSVDGYTVLSKNSSTGFGSEAVSGANYPNAFGNSASISFAESYVADGEGNFAATVDGNNREISPVLVSHGSAQAWAGGIAVARADEDPFVLMSMTRQECANGKTAYLVACSSTDFALEGSMKSAVLGNSRTLTEIIRYMGKDNAPSGLVFKPFASRDIDSLTTMVANTWTAVLVTVPTLTVAAIGITVLIRRKNR